jgi:hypothetical protein
MKHSGTLVKGYTMRDGKLVKITGYGLNASAKIAQKSPKRVRVSKGKPR